MVAENSPDGTLVGTLSATDPDAGATHSFALLSNGAGRLRIDGNRILVNGVNALNYEAAAAIEIDVAALDQSGGSLIKRITIAVGDVNDRPTAPTLTGNQLAEDSTGTITIGTLASTDEDGDRVIFSLPVAADRLLFEVVDDKLVFRGPPNVLDFEVKPTHNVTVEASDGKGGSATTVHTVVITNSNDAPTTLAVSKREVTENTAAFTAVAVVSAMDEDDGDSLVFTVTDPTGTFQLRNSGRGVCSAAATSGVSCSAVLELVAAVNFEVRSVYPLVVSVVDSGGKGISLAVNIKVLDANDAPFDLRYALRRKQHAADPRQVLEVPPLPPSPTLPSLQSHDVIAQYAIAQYLQMCWLQYYSPPLP